MKCALAAVGFINENIENNKNTIVETMKKCSGKADVVIFGEAFLQGFYGLNFDEEHDSHIAVTKDSRVIGEIQAAARDYGIAVSFGFMEKEHEEQYYHRPCSQGGEKYSVPDSFKRIRIPIYQHGYDYSRV